MPDPIPNLKQKTTFVKTNQNCLNYYMKKYVLTINYDDELEDIESIEEVIDEQISEIVLPEDTTLIHKCITPHHDNNPKRYDELMSISVQSGFVIGDA